MTADMRTWSDEQPNIWIIDVIYGIKITQELDSSYIDICQDRDEADNAVQEWVSGGDGMTGVFKRRYKFAEKLVGIRSNQYDNELMKIYKVTTAPPAKSARRW